MDEKQHDDKDEPEAGFELKIPGIRIWGGPAQLNLLMPILKWMVAGAGIVWAVTELVRAFV